MDSRTYALIAAEHHRLPNRRFPVFNPILWDEGKDLCCEIWKELATSVDTQSSSRRLMTPLLAERLQ